ncbi:MAG: hypothetical protein K6T94_22570 [Paenibacillus sp.]|nr:hypothetical protein [Paenibacillus sp.]
MEYVTDVEVYLKNGEVTGTHIFKDEKVIINRAGHLWIKNNSEVVSELLESVKMWFKMDTDTGTTTRYNFKTSESTPVIFSTTYRVDSINEESGAILFGEM